MVVIRFEADRKIWKRVPYMEVKRFGDGTLRPLWKKTEVATVPSRPSNFVDIEDDEPAASSGPVESTAAPSPEVVQDEEEAEKPEKTEKKRPADKDAAKGD